MERYKELYNYSKEVLNAERERYYSIERKAAQYLTVLTLVLGLAGLSINRTQLSFIPPQGVVETLLFVLTILIWINLLASWYAVFSVLKLAGLSIPPLDDPTLKFFKEQKEIDIYYYLAQQMKESLEKNRVKVDQKARNLKLGYKLITVTVMLLGLFSVVYMIHRWH